MENERKKPRIGLAIAIAVVGVIFILWMNIPFSKTGKVKSESSAQKKSIIRPKIAVLMDSFYVQNSGWSNNSVTREKASRKLNEIIIDRGTQNLYDDIPFELSDIKSVKIDNYRHMAYLSLNGEFSAYLKIAPIGMTYSISIYAYFKKGMSIDNLSEGNVYRVYGKTFYVVEPAEIISDGAIQFPTLRIAVDSIVRYRSN